MKALAGPGDEMAGAGDDQRFYRHCQPSADERTRADAAAEEFRKLVS